MSHLTNPGVLLPVVSVPPTPVGAAVQERPSFADTPPRQVAGLVPFDGCCVEANAVFLQRGATSLFDPQTYDVGAIVNGVEVMDESFANRAAMDVFMRDLGFAVTDDWYYLPTDDTWEFTTTLPTGTSFMDDPEFEFLPCDTECRDECDFFLPVFGVTKSDESSYENDVTGFLFDVPIAEIIPSALFHFILQKMEGGTWIDKGFLNSSFGTEYNDIDGHDSYRGFRLNWGKVLLHYGAGCYRVKAQGIWTVTEEIQVENTFTATLPENMTIGTIGLVMDNGKKVAIHIGDTVNPTELQTILARDQDLKQQGVSDVVVSRDGGGVVSIQAKGRIQNDVRRITITAEPAPYITPRPSVPPADEDDDTFEYDSSAAPTERTVFYAHCKTSRPFRLQEWNCELADRTAKFETWTDGKIGDHIEPYLIHDLCGMDWFDSVRVWGWFGGEKVPEYRKVQLEWGRPFHGKIEPVSNEAVHGYTFNSLPMPHWLHERLAVYMMMADEIRASDYNLLNSNFNIKRLSVTGDSGYEASPVAAGVRDEVCEVSFKRGVQGVIKSSCC